MTYSIATVTTHFDLLHSTIGPQALLDAAQRLRLEALGIVDRATTLGHVPVARAARETGVHVAFGATLLLEDGYPLRLLARTDTGYRNLCRLVSLQAAGQTRLPWDALHTYRHGLYLLCGGRGGRLWQAVAAGDDARVLWLLGRLQSLAERDDHFIVEAQQDDRDATDEHLALRRLLELAGQTGARCIATHDVQVLNGGDGSKHRLVSAIDCQASFWADDERLPPWRAREPSRFRLPEPDAWRRRWEGLEHLVAGSAVVLRDCQVELLGRKRFPGTSLPAARIYDGLWSRAFNGLKRRYGQVRPDLIQRLTYEVDEVMAQEVGPFLLYAAELVERAAARGIKMVLQGSGTGSLLCYALGISPVDPLTTEALVFERFCGRHRGAGDLPDLDFGVPAGREQEVKAILVEMFGAERVAHLAAVVTLRDRGAIRTAATAFGWTRDQIRQLHRSVKQGAPLDRHEQMVVNAGRQIAGQPHHLMRHASGVVVTDEPMAELYGVGATQDGPLLLANKDDVELLQVLKFDILPWYGLAIFDQAEASIHAANYPKPDLWHVAGVDDLTGDLLEQADTRCIPYLQSPACMTIIRALRVRTEADIALALGALRPGASHTRDRLMAAIHGGAAVLPGWETLTAEHQAAVTEALKPSRGALIFEEDLLRLANMMGLSFADAERLRKVLAKADGANPLVNKLRAAALRSGWNDREIDTVLHWMQYIQRYTFTKGHAMALAHATWRVARIAAHYPAHFYAAVLDHLGLGVGGGMYPILVYAVEARRHGLHVQGPTINSAWQSAPEERGIRCGMLVLQAALSIPTLRRIHDEARRRPFASVTDLCARVTLTARELEQLIAAGALDELAPSRRHARWQVQYAQAIPRDQTTLLDDQTWRPPVVDTESLLERAREEWQTLGFPISLDHPLALVEGELRGGRVVRTDQLGALVGTPVAVAGLIVASRRIRAAGDRPMAFASICDRSGVIEATLFGNVAERYAEALHGGGLVVARGIVTQDPERGIGLDIRALRVLDAHV